MSLISPVTTPLFTFLLGAQVQRNGPIESRSQQCLQSPGDSTELIQARLDVLNNLGSDPDFLRNLFYENTYDQATRLRYIKALADVMPRAVINNFERYRDLPGREQILARAANNDPEGAEAYYKRDSLTTMPKRGRRALIGGILCGVLGLRFFLNRTGGALIGRVIGGAVGATIGAIAGASIGKLVDWFVSV